eukprot:2738766-Rhodomonas_salina.1
MSGTDVGYAATRLARSAVVLSALLYHWYRAVPYIRTGHCIAPYHMSVPDTVYPHAICPYRTLHSKCVGR